MMRWMVVGGVLMAIGAGCAPKLETGYEPRLLRASSAERKGFYAGEFSPAQAEAAAESENAFRDRRPDMIR